MLRIYLGILTLVFLSLTFCMSGLSEEEKQLPQIKQKTEVYYMDKDYAHWQLTQLKERAEAYYRNKDYPKAIEAIEEGLALAQKEHGQESLDAAELMSILSSLYILSEGYSAKATELNEKAIEIRRRNNAEGLPLGFATEVFFDAHEKSKEKDR